MKTSRVAALLIWGILEREAMWINFVSTRPFAIKLFLGGVNALSGEPLQDRAGTEGTTIRRLNKVAKIESKQDYVVAPEQRWIDGIASETGAVKQFIAMPLGSGYSVEAQVTGKEITGGLQFLIVPSFPPVPSHEAESSQEPSQEPDTISDIDSVTNSEPSVDEDSEANSEDSCISRGVRKPNIESHSEIPSPEPVISSGLRQPNAKTYCKAPSSHLRNFHEEATSSSCPCFEVWLTNIPITALRSQVPQIPHVPTNAGSWRLFVASLTGRTFAFELSGTENTVADLKLAIEKHEGGSHEQQRLLFCGRQLEDRKPSFLFDTNRTELTRSFRSQTQRLRYTFGTLITTICKKPQA